MQHLSIFIAMPTMW